MDCFGILILILPSMDRLGILALGVSQNPLVVIANSLNPAPLPPPPPLSPLSTKSPLEAFQTI